MNKKILSWLFMIDWVTQSKMKSILYQKGLMNMAGPIHQLYKYHTAGKYRQP